MDVKSAKTIPITLVLDKIGYQPTKQRNGELTYFSPLRNERTPSFHVNEAMNAWFDFGEGKGGNTLDFVCTWLASQGEGDTCADALRWLRNMTGNQVFQAPIRTKIKKAPSLIIDRIEPIQHKALLGYLHKRQIPLNHALPHIQQVFVKNRQSGKSFYALGMKNEEGGMELRNPYFKGCAGVKHISFVRAKTPKPDKIHIVEGMFDFLSLLSMENINLLSGDAIVLHSLSCLRFATPYIQGYGYKTVHTWLDNDGAGDKATATLSSFLQTQDQLQHKAMNAIYHPHKDINTWHLKCPLPPRI